MPPEKIVICLHDVEAETGDIVWKKIFQFTVETLSHLP